MIAFALLLSLTPFVDGGCGLFQRRAAGLAFDQRDYIEIPKGTVLKSIPFYVNGEGGEPERLDFVTPEDGAWYSGKAQEIALGVKRG